MRVGAIQEQTELLQSIVDIQIPERITTVGQALEYLLQPYGFQLQDDEDSANEQILLFTLNLPRPHRAIGPITLFDALALFGGKSFTVKINPVTRRVSYTLKTSYRQYISENDVETARRQWLALKATEARSKPQETDSPLAEEVLVYGYGPVKPGETLGEIASYFKLNGLSLDQGLVALFQANPDAFANDNMNHLREGALLTVPAFDQSNALPKQEASHLVDQHYREWISEQVTQ